MEEIDDSDTVSEASARRRVTVERVAQGEVRPRKVTAVPELPGASHVPGNGVPEIVGSAEILAEQIGLTKAVLPLNEVVLRRRGDEHLVAARGNAEACVVHVGNDVGNRQLLGDPRRPAHERIRGVVQIGTENDDCAVFVDVARAAELVPSRGVGPAQEHFAPVRRAVPRVEEAGPGIRTTTAV